MVSCDVLIVGGGPAGSTCAWKLHQAGRDVLLLDRMQFPRPKPCAGWITPRVLAALEISRESYPLSLRSISTLTFHFPRFTIPVPTRQFAIRRLEFDDWLLQRASTTVVHHEVTDIRKEQGCFVVDGAFRAKTIVGAGGTACPVYKTFFRGHRVRPASSLITSVEAEFPSPVRDQRVRLWFAHWGLPGYAWYVPKANGYLNIGIGGFAQSLKRRGKSIREYWSLFLEMLSQTGLFTGKPSNVTGHAYAIRLDGGPVELDGCYIVGDAAGLATRDMGEGIGPAVESGRIAARSIVENIPFSVSSIRSRSLWDIVLPYLAAT